MPHTQEHPAQKYLNLREQNLIFFQHNYPGIYQFISTYQMQTSKLDILPETNEIDILVNGEHLYKSKSKQYAKHEVATFLSSFDYGSKIHSFRPLEQDAYKNQRFFARSMNKIQDSYYDKTDSFDGYELGDFLPLVVFMGIGLGKHIDILSQIRDMSHVIALETDMDKFAASLYSVDWKNIVEPFLKDPTKSFQFILLPGPENENHIYASLWNALLKYCPMFPVTTLFYNHLGNPVFDKISDRVNSDIYVHLFSFGNIDDELNQLNNALHNFRESIPFLNIDNLKDIRLPTCIVGSGPSLDARINDLQEISGRAIIISSGTALRALWKHGITPDFQVELESDFNTYITQGMMEDKDYMRAIKLLGAAQLNPLMFSLFNDARIFFKDDGALSGWFGNQKCIIENATPTCTNAALAIAFKLKASCIFLFGLDYGFPDKESHHASGSVYYKGKLKDQYKVKADDMIEVASAPGGKILTTTFLYTAKRRIENMLISSGSIKLFNCSNGAHLENAQWLAPGKTEQTLSKYTSTSKSKIDFINTLFSNEDKALTKANINKSSDKLSQEMHSIIKDINTIVLNAQLNSLRNFNEFCSKIFPILNQLELTNKSMFYFIRGSIWHFLLAGLTHVYSLDQRHIESYLVDWKNYFLDMLSMLGRRFESIAKNELNLESDPMVNHRLCEALMDELIWEYQNYSIINGEIYLDSAEIEYAGYSFDGEKYVPAEKD